MFNHLLIPEYLCASVFVCPYLIVHVCNVCVCICVCVYVCVCMGVCNVCSNYEASSIIMEITLMAFPIKTKRTTQISHTYLLYMVNIIMLSFHVPGDSPPWTTD